MDQTYDISGMHCANCVERISAALKPFAKAVRDTLTPPQENLGMAGMALAALRFGGHI